MHRIDQTIRFSRQNLTDCDEIFVVCSYEPDDPSTFVSSPLLGPGRTEDAVVKCRGRGRQKLLSLARVGRHLQL